MAQVCSRATPCLRPSAKQAPQFCAYAPKRAMSLESRAQPILLGHCREAVNGRHADVLDWERIVDFSHGSFRLMGSRKPKHIQKVRACWL